MKETHNKKSNSKLIQSGENSKSIPSAKSQFDIDFEKGMSVDEVFEDLQQHVHKVWHEWDSTSQRQAIR